MTTPKRKASNRPLARSSFADQLCADFSTLTGPPPAMISACLPANCFWYNSIELVNVIVSFFYIAILNKYKRALLLLLSLFTEPFIANPAQIRPNPAI
jgi:hypothetical protein